MELHYQAKLSNLYLFTSPKDRFEDVIKDALLLEMAEEKLEYQAQIVKSSEYPELSVIDYMLWAVQRFIKIGETRFLNAFRDKIGLIHVSDHENYIKSYSISEFLNLENIIKKV